MVITKTKLCGFSHSADVLWQIIQCAAEAIADDFGEQDLILRRPFQKKNKTG